MILGLNYSSYHDSAIALVNSTNTVSFAASEERYSRVKKDGRFPIHSLAQIDLGNVDFISIPYLEHPLQIIGQKTLYLKIFFMKLKIEYLLTQLHGMMKF